MKTAASVQYTIYYSIYYTKIRDQQITTLWPARSLYFIFTTRAFNIGVFIPVLLHKSFPWIGWYPLVNIVSLFVFRFDFICSNTMRHFIFPFSFSFSLFYSHNFSRSLPVSFIYVVIKKNFFVCVCLCTVNFGIIKSSAIALHLSFTTF